MCHLNQFGLRSCCESIEMVHKATFEKNIGTLPLRSLQHALFESNEATKVTSF